MPEEIYKKSEIKKLRKVRELTPESFKAYTEFDKQVMADGALPKKVKELMAIAVAHTTQCPFCIDFHTKEAKKVGATEQEIIEAV
jgi:AhpD family alkylhydroperoxidase